MKIYSIPQKLKAIIFDIDGTLYTSNEYVFEQVDIQIRHWADQLGISHKEAREKIENFRKEYSGKNGGKKISLGNTFTHFGIDIDTSIKWRNALMEPEKFISPDPELVKAVEYLASKYILIAVTNNPVFAATRTLKAIGLDKFIPTVIGLDTCKKSKPAQEILNCAMETLNLPPEEILSVGDRFDIDLALPLDLGMGAVLVDGHKDVVELAKQL